MKDNETLLKSLDLISDTGEHIIRGLFVCTSTICSLGLISVAPIPAVVAITVGSAAGTDLLATKLLGIGKTN